MTDNQENTVLGVCFTSKASCFGDIFQTVLRFFPWREIQGPDGNLPRELLLRHPRGHAAATFFKLPSSGGIWVLHQVLHVPGTETWERKTASLALNTNSVQ